MNPPHPQITIITPSFNQGRFIDETIQSVIGQKYPNVEHLVIDGGSTDETIDVLKRYPHIIWESQKDRGQTHAVNKGVQKATGEIVGWVNSDDTFLPGCFDAVAERFLAEPDCSVVYGDYHAIDENGKILYSKESFCQSYEDMIRWWDYTYSIHQPTVFVRKQVFMDVGLLDESYHYAMDYEWWLRVAKKFQFRHIPKYLATYRFHKEAKSFAPLERYVYPDQLRASRNHWGPLWSSRYWGFRRSYQAWKVRKPKETLHDESLKDWFDGAK